MENEELIKVVEEGFEKVAAEVEEKVTAKTAEEIAALKEEMEAERQKAEARHKELVAFAAASKEYRKQGLIRMGDKFVSGDDFIKTAVALQLPGAGIPEGKGLTKEEFLNFQKALSEGTDSAGGYLVPEEWYATIVELLTEPDVITAYVSRLTTSRDTVHINSESTSPAGAFIGEGSSISGSTTDPAFAQTDISIYKYAANFLISNELLSDALSNVGQFLQKRVAEVFAYARQQYVISGTGSSQPSGITAVSVPSGNKEAFSAGSKPAYADWVNVYINRLANRYRRKATWLMTSASLANLLKLVDSNGQPLFNQSMLSQVPMKLWGRPIIEDDYVDTSNSDPDQNVYLVDLSRYVMVDNGRFRMDISRDFKFDTDQIAIRFIDRWGGSFIGTAGIAQLYAS